MMTFIPVHEGIFWVINCIDESEKPLELSIQIWITYRDEKLLPFGQILLGEGKIQLEEESDNAIQRYNAI
jgi:hypothetical protein